MKDLFSEHLGLILASYAVLTIMYSVWFVVSTRQWPYTEGKLIRADAKGVRVGRGSTVDVEYTYELAGVEYTGRRLSPLIFARGMSKSFVNKQIKQIQYCENGSIKVFYNPKKPQKSYLVIKSLLKGLFRAQ